jgi:hypothetical protein
MNHSKYFTALDQAFKGKEFKAAVEAGVKVAKKFGFSPKPSTIGIYYWRFKKQGSVNKYGTWRNNPKKSKWLAPIANKGKHKKGQKAKKSAKPKASKVKGKRVSAKLKARRLHDRELTKDIPKGKSPAQLIAESNPSAGSQEGF